MVSPNLNNKKKTKYFHCIIVSSPQFSLKKYQSDRPLTTSLKLNVHLFWQPIYYCASGSHRKSSNLLSLLSSHQVCGIYMQSYYCLATAREPSHLLIS